MLKVLSRLAGRAHTLNSCVSEGTEVRTTSSNTASEVDGSCASQAASVRPLPPPRSLGPISLGLRAAAAALQLLRSAEALLKQIGCSTDEQTRWIVALLIHPAIIAGAANNACAAHNAMLARNMCSGNPNRMQDWASQWSARNEKLRAVLLMIEIFPCRPTEEEEPRATDCLAELLGAGTSPAADAPTPAERLTTALQLIEVLLVTAATAPHVRCWAYQSRDLCECTIRDSM